MSMIWHLTIHWQSDLLLLHLCSTLWIVFFGHYGAFNLKFADSGTTLNLLFSLLHVIKHKHYINGSAMCQWDPRVAGFLSLQWPFHWLVSILWLNMCKPVKSADGKTVWIKNKQQKNSTLGPWQHVVEHYCTTKSRSDSIDKKKKKIKKRCCDCIEKDFLQMHATNNHSDINFPLKFLLMMFLSDALMVSNGVHFHTCREIW